MAISFVSRSFSFPHLEPHHGVVEVVREEGLRQLAEERLEDDGRDVHVAVLENDLLAAVDFALKEDFL